MPLLPTRSQSEQHENRSGCEPSLWVVGLASQYPPYLLSPEKLGRLAARFYDVESPGIQQLLKINQRTGIQTRSAVSPWGVGFGAQPEPPSIADIDRHFRDVGVYLTAQACEKAIAEWAGDRSSITHTIGVTCTSQGNPGYDLLVNLKLGLSPDVDRMLLHGVGCAGGLAILRAAAQIAIGATARGKPARILAYACELCTPLARSDLAAAERSSAADVGIAGALFSDGAAAFVLCNDFGLDGQTKPLLELVEWGTTLIPSTVGEMSFFADPYGFRTTLSRRIPDYTLPAILPMFKKLLPAYSAHRNLVSMKPDDFDWALHPGGEAILSGGIKLLGLTEDHIRASRKIYQTRGNSGSPTVLAVLDMSRTMGEGREHVVATSFGPGLTIEMALLRRCQRREL